MHKALKRLGLSGLLSVSMASALLADHIVYHNDRFGISGLVPMGYLAQPAPDNADGRTFRSADGRVTLAIYGSHDSMGDLPSYRRFLTELQEENGSVTYQAGGSDWFVLSGYDGDGQIYYLRVEQGNACDGAPAYAHLHVTYDESARAQVDHLLAELGRGLRFGPC